jgi:hypothetical protein
MRRIGFHIVAAGVCLIGAVNSASAAEVKWAKSFDAAVAAAKQSNKLVMADFYTDW